MRHFEPDDQVVSVDFSETAAFSNQRIELQPFTVVCGLHGSGKSSLLGYIAECLYRGSARPDTPPFYGTDRYRESRPYLKGDCRVSLRRGSTLVDYSVDLNASLERGSVPREVMESGGELYPRLLNPGTLSTEVSMFFQDFNLRNLDTPAGEIEPQDRKDLDALRDILGVTYDEVIYVPVETDPGYSSVWPYVKARKGSHWIDSHSMSYGELCVHFMRWALKHPWGGPLLLDEPEANIAPRGHAALVDELARLARASKVQVVLATHSAAFIGRVPLEWVRMCVRGDLSPAIVTPSRASDLRNTLGIENPLTSIILVEDEVAECALMMILAAHHFSAVGEVETITAGSWNDVLNAAKVLAKSDRITSVAVLDGDQRGRISENSNVLCLPGSAPPEKVFFEYAAARPSEMAEKLGCTKASMQVYLAELAGLEHHRWLTILSRRTGHDWKYCLRVAFEIWRSDARNREQCEALARRIEGAVIGVDSGT